MAMDESWKAVVEAIMQGRDAPDPEFSKRLHLAIKHAYDAGKMDGKRELRNAIKSWLHSPENLR